MKLRLLNNNLRSANALIEFVRKKDIQMILTWKTYTKTFKVKFYNITLTTQKMVLLLTRIYFGQKKVLQSVFE
jgi:hypothetical protein